MVIQQASVIDFLANNGELKHLQEIFNDYHELIAMAPKIPKKTAIFDVIKPKIL